MKAYARTYQAELSAFLLARIAEDEARIEEGIHPADAEVVADGLGSHLTGWEVARWRAECEAKRRIVEQAIDAQRAVDRWTYERLLVDTSSPLPEEAREGAYNEVLRYLAAPYGDHPEFPEG